MFAPGIFSPSAIGLRYGVARLLVNVMIVTLVSWAVAPARAETVLVALGDSLTAGYGLPADQAFPVQLQAALQADGLAARVINAGVSGDTSAGGLARLDWVLSAKPSAAIVALGANDVLRGVDPAETEANLDRILTRLKARGVRVLLAGMLAPPNLGPEYRAAFDAIYPRLAARHGVPLYPFLLQGVALDRALNQSDGIHPTAAGVAVMVRGILPLARALLEAKP
jgi:acyl-CoA thioesterase I